VTGFCAFCIADDACADLQQDEELLVCLCRRCREGDVREFGFFKDGAPVESTTNYGMRRGLSNDIKDRSL
jgi:hypothetical protein